MNEEIRVLIVDDHVVVRSGIRMLLDAEPDIEVVGEASDGSEALDLVQHLQPHVVLMDIAMPVINGLDATRKIKRDWPDINVLVLTMHRSEEYFYEVLKSGGSGYILKAADSNDLVNAVRIVSRGEIFLNPSLAQRLVKDYLNLLETGADHKVQLSPRESEIFELLVKGYSNKEIADKLVLSPSTVYTHKNNLMKKLGLSSRRELIQYASDLGILNAL